MLKRIATVSALAFVVSVAATAAPLESGQVEGSLGLTYKGMDKFKPVYGATARLGYVFTENIDASLRLDWYFQPKDAPFYTLSLGPAVHFNFPLEGALTPYVGVGANFYMRDKWAGAATVEINGGVKYAVAEATRVFGEVAWEAAKSKVFSKTPFDLRVGVSRTF